VYTSSQEPRYGWVKNSLLPPPCRAPTTFAIPQHKLVFTMHPVRVCNSLTGLSRWSSARCRVAVCRRCVLRRRRLQSRCQPANSRLSALHTYHTVCPRKQRHQTATNCTNFVTATQGTTDCDYVVHLTCVISIPGKTFQTKSYILKPMLIRHNTTGSEGCYVVRKKKQEQGNFSKGRKGCSTFTKVMTIVSQRVAVSLQDNDWLTSEFRAHPQWVNSHPEWDNSHREWVNSHREWVSELFLTVSESILTVSEWVSYFSPWVSQFSPWVS